MTIYIVQGKYTQDAIAGMIEKPEDRGEAVAGLVKGAGGKMLDYFVTFGEYDFLVVVEAEAKETDIMAALFAALSMGGVTDLKTIVGVRSREAMNAMVGAKKLTKGFDPAG